MRTGKDFLITQSKSLEKDVEELENKLEFKLPKLYREFLLNYELGEDKLLLEEFYVKQYQRTEMVGPASFRSTDNKVHVSIDWFFDISEVYRFWNSSDKYEETGMKKLLPIAVLCNHPNGGLYVGFGDDNKDKIYLVRWDGGENWLTLVTDSINLLVDGLFQEYDNFDLNNKK